jgi:hypothetical protein
MYPWIFETRRFSHYVSGLPLSVIEDPKHDRSGGYMEIGPMDAKAGLDRFATMDEIQAALTVVPDVFLPCETDSFWEIPSDRGGYVRIATEDEDSSLLSLIEKLDSSTN